MDGNKRIGVYGMLTFLEVNGIRLDCTNEDAVKIGLGVADGNMDYEALLGVLRLYRTPGSRGCPRVRIRRTAG